MELSGRLLALTVLSLGKENQYPLNRGLEGSQSRSVRSAEEKTTLVPADYRTTIRRLSSP